MKKSKVKGWAVPSSISLSNSDVFVSVHGVCTCSWHAQRCVRSKECAVLGSEGGDCGMVRTLKRLMGKKFPRHWDCWGKERPSISALVARGAMLRLFKQQYYRLCRPVTVAVKVVSVAARKRRKLNGRC
jgi:hypothetical protein